MTHQIQYMQLGGGDGKQKPKSSYNTWCEYSTIGFGSFMLITMMISLTVGALGFVVGTKFTQQEQAGPLWLCK